MDVPTKALPDPEGTTPIVSEDVNPQEQEERTAAPVVSEATTVEQPSAKGDKTPDERLYAALEEERRMRKDAERRLKERETSETSVSLDDYSDEGKILKQSLNQLKEEISSVKDTLELERLYALYPDLKDKAAEFIEFRDEYPRTGLEKVAKLFLVEKDMLGFQTRKGLEKPSGGSKTPPSSNMNESDVKRLRETQPRRYASMLRSGKLNPDDIK